MHRPIVLSAFVLLLGAGCGSERTRAWEAYRDGLARWYPMAWGVPATDDMIEDARRKFDCIWDLDGDAAAGFACVTQTMNASVLCQEAKKSAADTPSDCLAPSGRGCVPSQPFKQALERCRGTVPAAAPPVSGPAIP